MPKQTPRTHLLLILAALLLGLTAMMTTLAKLTWNSTSPPVVESVDLVQAPAEELPSSPPVTVMTPRPFANSAGGFLGQEGVSVTGPERPWTPSMADVHYGPLPAQVLDVWRPEGASVGTIVYFHSGAWAGNDHTKVPTMITDQLDRGWAIVSVEYRLTPTGIGAAEISADADRAIRFTRANATAFGLNISPLVVAGGSAGGHIASLAAAAPGVHAAADLPLDLALTSPNVDALIDLVGPTDLNTLWKAGGIAPDSQEALLRCTLDETRVNARKPMCEQSVVDSYNPLWWAQRAVALPPAFFAYGGLDTLVRPDTQGWPMFQAWTNAAGASATWLDVPDNSGHNLPEMSHQALAAWLDQVALR